MAKKRKSDAARLDEVDRTMYSTFRSAANSLSQIYTQAMNQQKLAFQAGERHALEKLYQWIIRQHEEGSRITLADIVGYLQNAIDGGAAAASARPHYALIPSVLLGSSAVEVASHRPSNHSDQSKNSSVFSNALSSPVRRSLQPYHLAQIDECHSAGGGRNNEGVRESNSHDSSMDMHSDSSPTHQSY